MVLSIGCHAAKNIFKGLTVSVIAGTSVKKSDVKD